MIINADLHIHGRYSIATSKNMIPPIMAPQAKLKGLDLVATGDALHQKWITLLEETIRRIIRWNIFFKGQCKGS